MATFDPFDCTHEEARNGARDTRRDERAWQLDADLDRRTLRTLVRNETNARRV